jgi:prolyl 4-hydroxylase
MKNHNINELNNFICGWYLKDTSICDDIIEYYENANTEKHIGRVLRGIDTQFKDSIDAHLEGFLQERYLKEVLLPCTDLYREKYPYCNVFGQWEINQEINIQKYVPGAGFHAWHTERGTKNFPASSRHIVFMTYLNDVTDDGETEFFHQNLKIKPEKGLTILWGSDWTFTHRGITSPTQTKYIVTGWWSFSE